MSHLARGKTKLNDLAALRVAAEEVGGIFNEGQDTFIWYSDTDNKCDHAISIKGKKHAYEIGLRKFKDGSGYEMLWDTYDGHLENQFGEGMINLIDHYNLHAVQNQQGMELQRLGFQEFIERSEGQVVLRYQRM